MNRLAIIPARGGSKRIPGKNIKNFLGRPIIAYSIEVAIASGLFDEVMVSTDDDEIAKIALDCGATIPFMRSEENADDFSTTVDVLLEVLDNYKKQNTFFEQGCCIYPTAPLIKAERLRQGLSLMEGRQYATVFPVTAFSYPIWRSLKIKDDAKAEMLWPEHQNKRSQDLEAAYHDAGQFYWFNTAAIEREKKLFGDNTGIIKLDEIEVQDIDTITDWNIAEMKYKFLHGA
jgi:pseudaminic acid cytidylyltransferase